MGDSLQERHCPSCSRKQEPPGRRATRPKSSRTSEGGKAPGREFCPEPPDTQRISPCFTDCRHCLAGCHPRDLKAARFHRQPSSSEAAIEAAYRCLAASFNNPVQWGATNAASRVLPVNRAWQRTRDRRPPCRVACRIQHPEPSSSGGQRCPPLWK